MSPRKKRTADPDAGIKRVPESQTKRGSNVWEKKPERKET